jgi:drug/metabolite transporter (DMT)-like permease
MSTTVLAPAPRPPAAAHAGDDSASRPAPGSDQGRPETGGRPGPGGLKALGGLASVALNLAGPLLAYKLIRPHTDSSALALALSGLIPVAYTLVILAIQRRLSPLGMIGVITYGLGVLVSWASGGNTLALELQDPALTGLFGLACLGSVAIRRPLHRVILRWMGRSNPHYTDVANRAQTRTSMITTTIIGLAFTLHAAAVAVLALTQPTSTFVAWQQPVGLSFLALGIGGLFLYGTRQQARQRAAATAAARDNQPGDDQDGGDQAAGPS